MRNLLLLFTFAGALSAQEISLLSNRPPEGQKLWRYSMATLSVANVLDTHSSWGKHELNPALAGASGNFGGQSALIKLGFQGGLMGLEYLITRGHPSGKAYRVLAVINFGAAATIGGVAAHNYSIPRR